MTSSSQRPVWHIQGEEVKGIPDRVQRTRAALSLDLYETVPAFTVCICRSLTSQTGCWCQRLSRRGRPLASPGCRCETVAGVNHGCLRCVQLMGNVKLLLTRFLLLDAGPGSFSSTTKRR